MTMPSTHRSLRGKGEPTDDPTVVIKRREGDVVHYLNIEGEEWTADNATCDQCGNCWPDPADYPEGAYPFPYIEWRAPRGESGACWDTRYGQRLDLVNRPEMAEDPGVGCHMTYRWIVRKHKADFSPPEPE